MAKFNDIKLVTYCVQDNDVAKDLILKEYLAYKMYNEITPQSYRVQLVQINYRDIATGNVEQQLGFLIEDTDQMRARIGAKKNKNAFNLSKEKYNGGQVKVVALFQYMIGNSDWSITHNRNVKVLLKNGKNILIPFDFDFSGLVNAPYVRLKPEHGIATATERVFLGFPDDVKKMKGVMRIFEKNKPAFLKIIKDCSQLDKDSKREISNYIESFYRGAYYLNLPKESVF